MCDKENKKMATNAIDKHFTLNEQTAKKILMTPRTKLPEINVFNDITLRKSDRISHAANILKSRKKWK